MAKSEAQRGIQGQNLVERILKSRDFVCVEGIGTPFLQKMVKGRNSQRNGWLLRWIKFFQKPSGDHRAFLPDKSGRGVLIETKTITDRETLRWSDLRKHQPGKLDKHVRVGAVVLLAWVHTSGVYLMQWPVPGFAPGRNSIKLERAKQLDIESAWQFCPGKAPKSWVFSRDEPCAVCEAANKKIEEALRSG